MARRKYHYVYALIDPRTVAPFYIGKGTGDRMMKHFQNIPKRYQGDEGQARYIRIKEIKDAGLTALAQIISHHDTDAAALDEERRMIALIGLGNLTNENAGGGGDKSKKRKTKANDNPLPTIAEKPKNITSKHDAFCMCIADPQVPDNTAAYREAFDCTNMAPATVNNEAYKLLQRPEITARVEVYRGYLAGGKRYSINEAIDGQERAVELADDTGAAGAMSGAYREIAKLSDLYPREAAPDTIVNMNVEGDVTITDKELARQLAHILERGSLDK
jgi:hypothetical protein